ncbi:MAG TPA: 2-oxoglutarate dehydrogenase E1 component, partial [Gammaproteobacteria bacterium]|nr:2-oxoglutarate dehydrogenase E1 component [Gammaproteobacteria bacterium]
LCREFEEQNLDTNRSGDVKYHKGFASDMNTPGGPIHLAMAFNPSHLEIVGPVVEGAVRARQDRWQDHPGDRVLPVVIHGDAAFAGQGVVTETFNLSETRGYKTRGTLHIIINNQIGFTTNIERDARSTFYCSDVSRMINVPVFHVNGDDPEAVVRVARLAFDYRRQFHKDVVIDLVCYRRHGHNEADEPAVTQPLMYRKIRALPTTRERYAQRLMQQQVLAAADAEALVETARRRLEQGDPVVPHLLDSTGLARKHPIDWKRFVDGNWDEAVPTGIDTASFRNLGERMTRLPEDLQVHNRVARVMAARRKMVQGEQALDWGFCETLAYASLLEQGYAVRLSGQDSSRGTFFHRHAVLYDQEDGHSFVPLKNLSDRQARFVVVDSLLSEEAVLAFEYGYATTEPDALVIWESQFGDFANTAQVVIDQFISSGEQKWGRLSGLVMYLPHGYEGQGPEHSSARIERYLQLCSQINMQVCVPSTPAQVFHMLRRQMLRRFRKPLIVITPKSMLRHPAALSTVNEICEGRFHAVLGEVDALDASRVTRLVLCMGKVYYDLVEQRRNLGIQDTAILRIEQLYPFPSAALVQQLQQYPALRQAVWCQEEPRNQGAWYSQKHHLEQALGAAVELECVSRPGQASSASGSLKVHQAQQAAIVAAALGVSGKP